MRFNPGEGLQFLLWIHLGILVHRFLLRIEQGCPISPCLPSITLPSRYCRRFLLRVEQGYPNNPYHSRVHAADVLRMFHVVLTRGGVLSALMASSRARAAVSPPHDSRVTPQHEHGGQQVMRDGMALSSFSLPFSINMRQDGHATAGMGSFGARHVTWGIPHLNADACAFPMWHLCVRPLQGDIVLMSKLLGCYLAATIHDYGHRGVNNDFLIKTSDPLALLYNDVSPMENHHVAAAFILMQEEQYAFFSVPNKRVRIR